MVSLIYTTLFFLEGLGIKNIENLIYFVATTIPLFLYVSAKIKKRSLYIPKEPILLYLIFMLSFLFSILLFSLDKEVSLIYLFVYLYIFALFVYFYNFKIEAEKTVNVIIIISSALFTLIYIVKSAFPHSLSFIGNTENNLLVEYNKHNNHLGDLLGFVIIWFFYHYLKNKNKKYLFISTLFLIPFILSFSRAAYLAVLITGTVMMFKEKIVFFAKQHLKHQHERGFPTQKGLVITNLQARITWFANLQVKSKAFLSLLIYFLVTVFLLISLSRGYGSRGIVANISSYLHIPIKSTFGGRLSYFSQAIKGSFIHPFGIGYGNFQYISKQYQGNIGEFSSLTTNWFLEILIGTGVLGFIAMLVFVVRPIIDGFKRKQTTVYLYLATLAIVLFMTAYSYSIISFLSLFFVLLAIVYHDNHEKRIKLPSRSYLVFSLILFIFSQSFFLSYFFLSANKPRLALTFFPYNKKALISYAKELDLKQKHSEALIYLKHAESISPNNFSVITNIAKHYKLVKKYPEAINYYKKLFSVNQFTSEVWVEKLYLLIKQVYGPDEAEKFLRSRLKFYRENLDDWYTKSTSLNLRLLKWCKKNGIENICQLELQRNSMYYEPTPHRIEKFKVGSHRVKYVFNNHGFNDVRDYKFKKDKNTFRVVIMGGGKAFGLLVKTKDNLSEQLRNVLNSNTTSLNKKKYEVINIGYHNDDFLYSIEHFENWGRKYNPDVVLWIMQDPTRINDIFISYLDKARLELENKGGKKGNFPEWTLAYKNYRKEVPENFIMKEQTNLLKNFLSKHKNINIMFISTYQPPEKIKELISSQNNTRLFVLNNVRNNPEYYFKDIDAVSPEGYEYIAKQILKYLRCLKLL